MSVKRLLTVMMSVCAGLLFSMAASVYAATDTGSVWTNGWNYYGTHGSGTTDNNINLYAERLKNLGGIVDIAYGTSTGYALRSDGTVWSWGQNDLGQLGIGTSDYSAHPDPVQIPGLSNIIAISAGGYHAFAISATRTVYAWGGNDKGQLGIGSADTSPHPTPVTVAGLANVVALATGDYHTIALHKDGWVWGWGNNTYGQLGGGYGTCGTPPTQFNSPTLMYNCNTSTYLTDVVAVAAGTMHSMALSPTGEVYAWGFNSWSLLGDGGTTQRNYPNKVRIDATPTYLSGVTAISAGWHHSVALRNSGEIWGWGDNDAGQLAQGNYSQGVKPFALYVSEPSFTYGEQTMLSVSAANEHTVGLRSDGKVITAGSFQYGQSGRNDQERYFLPVYDYNMQTNITTAVAGSTVTSAIRSPWQKTVLDAAEGNTGQYSSIAVDHQDYVHISYYDPNSKKLMYTTNAPDGTWKAPEVVDSGTDTGTYSSIAVDSSNKAHISYVSNPGQYLKYANNATGSWTINFIDTPAYAAYTSIALGSNYGVHIAYQDQSTNYLKYAYGSVSSGWTPVLVDSSGNVGQYAAIAVDASFVPHIAYYDATNSDLKYATRPASTWNLSTIDSTGIVGQYAAIAVDSTSRVHISYYDTTNTSLKYATNVVGMVGWYTMTLDNTGSAGRYNSIAVDSLQRPHISYDATINKNGTAITELRYATKDTSGSWRLSVAERESAAYTGLRLDSLGRVHMVYYTAGKSARYVSNRDRVKPVGTILYNNGAQYTNSRTITLNMTCDDGSGLGCRLMEFSHNGSQWSTPDPFDTTKTYYLDPAKYPNDGPKIIYVRFTDHAGNVSSTFWEDSPYIILDTTPPSANSICINGCASYTNNPYVTVSMPATDTAGVTQIMLSNNGGFSEAWPQTYNSSVGWWMEMSEGQKNVFAQVMDKAGNWTVALAGSITLDMQPPTSGSVTITSKVNGATNNPTVNLSVDCTDLLSGCYKIELSNDKATWVPYLLEYPGTITAWNLLLGSPGDGPKNVYARFYDLAGNVTAFEIKDSVTLDTINANGSLTINGGAAFTRTPFVHLEMTCSDDSGTGCSQVQFSTDGLRWSAPEPYNPGNPNRVNFPLSESNELWLWGLNDFGQLGNGSTSSPKEPTLLKEPGEWSMVAEGAFHTAAIRSDGTLWAWGNNEYGQLGIDMSDTDPHPRPIQVGGDSDWVYVGTGIFHTLAVKKNGTLWAWGNNDRGQLGVGDTKPKSYPMQVGREKEWLQASGGDKHTVAMKSDGTLWTWGDGLQGQLGDESSYRYSPGTYPVEGGATWKQFKSGLNHTVAIRSDGTLWTWGDNSYGQLGQGGKIISGEYSYSPQQIGGVASWQSVSAGFWHNAAVKGDGTLWTWGRNNFGQLGIGGVTDQSSPQQILNHSNWALTAGGYQHTIGVKANGAMLAWGFNDSGTLGIGDSTTNDTPQPVISDDARWIFSEASVSTAAMKLVDGPKNVYARFRDNAGNWSEPFKAGIIYDSSVPNGTIAVNNNANFTNSTSVELSLTCSDSTSGCSQMCISNLPTCSSWEPFEALKSDWALLPNDGPKTVYAWFRDNALDETPATSPVMATTKLDSVPPTGTVQINSGLPYTAQDFVTLTISCQDGSGKSGCSAISISNDGSSWTQPEIIVENVALTKAWQLSTLDGVKKVYVRVKDAAGNWTPVAPLSGVPQATITLDRAAPAKPVVSGPSITRLATPTWNWSHDSSGNNTYRYNLDNTDTSSGTLTALSSYTPGNPLSDGLHTLYVSEYDDAGNLSTAGFKSITVDTVQPNAPIVSGTTPNNSSKPTWTWASGGGGGNGSYLCKLDNEDFSSPTASGAITSYKSATTLGEGAHILYVRELDDAGNVSGSGQFEIIVDTAAPSTRVSPDPGKYNEIQTVTLTCNDGAGDGVNCTTYYSTDGNPPTTLYTAPIPIPRNLTLRFYSIDSLGNREGDKSALFSYNQGMTRLSLEMSNPAIAYNGTLTLWGRLENMTANNADPTGEVITITITAPDGTTHTQAATIYDPLGLYQLNSVSGFNQKGIYSLRASFAGSNLLLSSNSTSSTLLVGASAGYAILIEGKIANQEGLGSHNKTANRIYNRLKSRGFVDDNIYYFNYDLGQTGVDATPTKAGIQTVIENWAKPRMNGMPAPLYIIMVDHGSEGLFHIGNETITPTNLSDWLGKLENGAPAANGNPAVPGLSDEALKEKRFVIIGSCYSGSFISALSQGPATGNGGRVIITSAAAKEVSYKGPQEPRDGVRSGEYFLEELFTQLERGYTFRQSFVEAAALTRTYTQKGGTDANTNAPYFDGAVQHPLLDDSGKGAGSNTLVDGALQDGDESKNLRLGAGINYSTNSASNPADITSVSETIFLNYNDTSATLWAAVNDDTQVDSAVWMEIRNLSTALTTLGGSEQAELATARIPLTHNQVLNRWERATNDPGLGTLQYQFSTSGKYEIFYFVRDIDTLKLAPMKRSVVYKAKTAEDTVPGVFHLQSPLNGGSESNMVVFSWDPASASTPVTYTLLLSNSPDFSQVIYRQEEITGTILALGPDKVALSDNNNYYWKIQATDSYGAQKWSEELTWYFHTDFQANGLPGIIQGYIKDSFNTPLAGTLVSAGSTSFTTKADGAFALAVPGGTSLSLTAAKNGYTAPGMPVSVASGGSLSTVITMSDNQAPVVTAFSVPATSNSLTVTISEFTATDNSGAVALYCITDVNSAATCSWGNKPTSFLATSSGSLSLYPWVKDASGNISLLHAAASTTIQLNSKLEITISGSGSGRVFSAPGGVDCLYSAGISSGSCLANFTSTTDVGLLASPDWNAQFSGWSGIDSGACSGTSCLFAPLHVNRSVTATFSAYLRAKTGANEYSTVAAAYAAATDSGDLLLQEATFEEALLFNINKTVTVLGGRHANYSEQPDHFTTIKGSIKINNGRVNAHQIAIKP